jgi:hypothetical protein
LLRQAQGNNPLAGSPRPKTRTTDGYWRERAEIEARARIKAEQTKGDAET